MSRMTCQKCLKDISYKNRYLCCQKLGDVCSKCTSKQCSKCLLKPPSYGSRSRVKEKSPAYRQSRGPSRCSSCKDQFPYLYQPFVDQKCNYSFCFRCILEFYLRYLRVLDQVKEAGGVVPEMGVDSPCGCEYNQEIVINFLKKYCVDCHQKLGSIFYDLSNQTRIKRICYDRLSRLVDSKLANSEEKKIFKTISNLILTCNSCGDPIRQVGSQVDGISICSFCFKEMKLTESMYERKKSQSLEKRQFLDEKKKAEEKPVKKVCLDCRSEFTTKDRGKDTPTICLKCLNEEEIMRSSMLEEENVKKIQELSLQDQLFDRNIKPVGKVPLDDIEVLEFFSKRRREKKFEAEKQSIIESIADELKQEKKEQLAANGSNCKGQSVEGLEKEQNKQKQEDKCQNRIQQEGNCKQKYINQMMGKQHIEEQFQPIHIELAEDSPGTCQCCVCAAFFQKGDIFKTFQKEEGGKIGIRIAETEQEVKEYEENKRLSFYCQVCYVQLKNEIKYASQKKMAYGYKSVSKPAKVPDIQMNSNIFSKYDRTNWTAHKEIEKPAKQIESKLERPSWMSSLRPSMFMVECIYCKNEYSVTREKLRLPKICKDCDKLSMLPKGRLDKVCIKCKQEMSPKQFQLGSNGVCYDCMKKRDDK